VSRAFVGFDMVCPCVYRPRLLGGRGEVVEAGWLRERERLEDVALVGGELGALGDGTFGDDEAHAVKLGADVAPAGGCFGFGDA
jgi:hypothetical protein